MFTSITLASQGLIAHRDAVSIFIDPAGANVSDAGTRVWWYILDRRLKDFSFTKETGYERFDGGDQAWTRATEEPSG